MQHFKPKKLGALPINQFNSSLIHTIRNHLKLTFWQFDGLGEKLFSILLIHYENTPREYTVIFHGCKNDYFQMKKCGIFLFLLKT